MTITVPISSPEFKQLKGDDKTEPRRFIILKENEKSTVGDTVIVQEIDDEGTHTGAEMQFEITYVVGDPQAFKKGWRSVGLKPKQ